ncbi:MAG TPA: HlyD family secretion protein [Chitinivibrionales bacterium]|nr:HlyD family secretion protein [Chitinivibrionales bacterium]
MNASSSQQSKPDFTQRPQNAPAAPNNGDQSIDDVPMFKRKRVIIPIFLLIIGVIAAVCAWYVVRFSSVATDDAFVDAYRATISSKILGRITALRHDEGDTVRQGDTLAVLDDTDLRAQLAKAEASLRLITRSVEISSVNRDKAIDDFERIEKQYKNQIVSQEQYNHADNARKLAEAQIDRDQAQVATAQADLAIVKTQLANTVITAPFSGVIARRWVLASDVVSPGQAIFSMFDDKHVWVTANYEETKLREIRPGMPVQISIDAFPGIVVKGKVESIGSSTASEFALIPPSNASGNFTKITQRVPIKIAVVQVPAGVSLLPGLSAFVRIFPR